MSISVSHIEFSTAAQMIKAIEKIAGKQVNLDETYVKDLVGDDLTEVALEQETLSDVSVVFNIVLSEAMDPDS